MQFVSDELDSCKIVGCFSSRQSRIVWGISLTGNGLYIQDPTLVLMPHSMVEWACLVIARKGRYHISGMGR